MTTANSTRRRSAQPSGRAADEICNDDESEDRKCDRRRSADIAAAARRPGDRTSCDAGFWHFCDIPRQAKDGRFRPGSGSSQGCYQSRFTNSRPTNSKIFQIATTRWVMIGTGWTPPIGPSFVQDDAAVRKKLRTGARSAHTFLLVGKLIGPGEPNATSAHPRDLIALAIAQIPGSVCLVGLRRAWLRIRRRTVTLSSLNVRAHRFLESHASLRVDEAAI